MNRNLFVSPARLLATIVAVGLAATVTRAQAPGPDRPQAPVAPAAQPAQPSPPNPDNDWLAKTSKLYYSSVKAGLTGFDCTVHPDWHTLFVSANKGGTIADDDPRMALLKTVKVAIHARMRGASTIDWVEATSPDKPPDDSSTALLEGMHRTVEQTLEGFLQFWTPFMEVSIVPDSVEGLEITHTPTMHTIHAKQGDTELTEIFSSDLVLEQFNVNMNGMSIKFAPSYKPSPQGLLVQAFDAHIMSPGATPAQEQVMKVGIDYQSVDGLTIPGRLNMEIVGTGQFNFGFDGCTTNPK
jgi:hypothetical protein